MDDPHDGERKAGDGEVDRADDGKGQAGNGKSREADEEGHGELAGQLVAGAHAAGVVDQAEGENGQAAGDQHQAVTTVAGKGIELGEVLRILGKEGGPLKVNVVPGS